MKKLVFYAAGAAAWCAPRCPCWPNAPIRPIAAEILREYFLEKANEVEVTDTSVIFTGRGIRNARWRSPRTPAETCCSVRQLCNACGTRRAAWPTGVIGGDSSIELYNLYIGRDVTQDEGVTVLAESSAGKNWNTETIIAFQPDLIICSTAMSGYKTISAPARGRRHPRCRHVAITTSPTT